MYVRCDKPARKLHENACLRPCLHWAFAFTSTTSTLTWTQTRTLRPKQWNFRTAVCWIVIPTNVIVRLIQHLLLFEPTSPTWWSGSAYRVPTSSTECRSVPPRRAHTVPREFLQGAHTAHISYRVPRVFLQCAHLIHRVTRGILRGDLTAHIAPKTDF